MSVLPAEFCIWCMERGSMITADLDRANIKVQLLIQENKELKRIANERLEEIGKLKFALSESHVMLNHYRQ